MQGIVKWLGVSWNEQFSACREYAELKSTRTEGIISFASLKKTFRLVCHENLHKEEGGRGGEGDCGRHTLLVKVNGTQVLAVHFKSW